MHAYATYNGPIMVVHLQVIYQIMNVMWKLRVRTDLLSRQWNSNSVWRNIFILILSLIFIESKFIRKCNRIYFRREIVKTVAGKVCDR